MHVHHMFTPSIKFARTHFYARMERGTIHCKNKLFDQKQNASKMLCPNQGSINLECSIESSMQTIRSPCHPQCAVLCLLCYVVCYLEKMTLLKCLIVTLYVFVVSRVTIRTGSIKWTFEQVFYIDSVLICVQII